MISENKIDQVENNNNKKYRVIELWNKYEDIAMHFNDLILKIRIQALAAVAAISTVVGFFNRNGENEFSWGLTFAVFFFLCLFWIAIWILDFRYYNRLLLGAVDALLELEKASKVNDYISEIQLSTLIEDAVGGNHKLNPQEHKIKSAGRNWFYRVVFVALFIGLLFSGLKVLHLF